MLKQAVLNYLDVYKSNNLILESLDCTFQQNRLRPKIAVFPVNLAKINRNCHQMNDHFPSSPHPMLFYRVTPELHVTCSF